MQKSEGTSTQTTKRQLSKTSLFFIGAFIALVSFVAGTRYLEWQAFIGNVLGVGGSAQTLNLGSVQSTYNQLRAKYDGKLDPQALIDGANRGMVQAVGDEHTVFLDAKEAEEFKKELAGDVGAGIGAQIGVRNGQPTVTRVLPDNPAIKAGVRDGDVVVAVNDESADGWTADKAASHIRGKAGTTVKLAVRRGNELKTFTVTRAEINNPSVLGEVKNGVGIMTITRFDSDTGRLARQAAESFKRQNVKGVVVDIRSDGGGYLDAAVDTAGLWLAKKLVVVQKHDGKVTERLHTKDNTVLHGVTTIVLVNGGTASASEIFAAALRDHGAAQIVGEQTYGKGSVQEVVPLGWSGALLKVTVARWYTARDANIDGKGLKPDQEVKLTTKDVDAGRDPQIDVALKLIK